MNSAFQSISIQEIPDNIYFEGYYWYSDQTKPNIVFPSKPIDRNWFKELPFVIEANFYARDSRISIQIKYIDGEYVVSLIDLNNEDDIVYEEKEYIGHDLNGKNFIMKEAWLPKPDDLLEGMKTLVPAWTAFAGFC